MYMYVFIDDTFFALIRQQIVSPLVLIQNWWETVIPLVQ